MNEFNTSRELEKKALEEKEAAELLIKQAADKESTAQLARLAAMYEADLYELSETALPWKTDMTKEQAVNIRAWAQTFL
eukprot:3006125-Heterocapsa_arctica.AAC.1